MPRSVVPKKNQHNPRHENGLVGPGKRITKQKSNGHLNGSPKGSNATTPPLPPDNSPDQLMTNPADNNSNGSLTDSKTDPVTNGRADGAKKRDSDSDWDISPSHQNGTLQHKTSNEQLRRRTNSRSIKNKGSHDVNPFHLATAIIKSCPVYDTIAVLIILLQIPPTFLALIQFLFASMTFIPPSGLSLNSIGSLFDVFQGSAGAPSLWTTILVDVICLGGWYLLWTWARNFALDLAQIQIAITLGGGNASKSGSVNTVCVTIVLLLHLIRSKGVRNFVISNIPAKAFSHELFSKYGTILPHESEIGTTPTSPWWLQLFAIHIVAQAFTAMVRRKIPGSQTTPVSKSGKRSDTEASAGAQTYPDSSAHESGPSASVTLGNDGLLSPLYKDGKDRMTSAKKRRRQANQIKSRQPFWAAIATTLVHAKREYDFSQVPTGSGHRPESEVGADSKAAEEDSIWITHVGASSIQFEASEVSSDSDGHDTNLDGTDSKPFYVRVNDTPWASISLCQVTPGDEQANAEWKQWRGEITGLAPNCTYTCEFRRSNDDEELCSMTVKTSPFLDMDQSSALASPLPRQSLRPSSPTTTIRNSIATAEAKLNESRARLARTKRAHKTSLGKAEREVEGLENRLKSSGDDSKQKQKLLQAQRNIKSTEDATACIAAQLEDLSAIPEEDIEDWNDKRAAFDHQTRILAAAKEDLETARSAATRDLTNVRNELASIVARRDRLMARQTRVHEQHDRITQANNQGLNEKERKAAEQHAREKHNAIHERKLQDSINSLLNDLNNTNYRISQAKQNIAAYDKAAVAQMLRESGTLTPEGTIPGTNPQPQHQLPQPLSSRTGFGYNYPPFNNSNISNSMPISETHPSSPFLAHAKILSDPAANARRARSGSNRSGRSNFEADFMDADPIPPMPTEAQIAEMERKGSGSSRGSPALATLGSPIRSQQGRNSPGHYVWGI